MKETLVKKMQRYYVKEYTNLKVHMLNLSEETKCRKSEWRDVPELEGNIETFNVRLDKNMTKFVETDKTFEEYYPNDM